MSEKNQMPKVLRYKKWMNILFILLFALVEGIIVALIGHAAWDQPPIGIFQLAAVELILIWFGILFGYYAWAVYFYSINFGLTNQDWAGIREKLENDEEVDMPTENPNKEETLGLPKGTVRGSIALTLLVGALAMVIHSFGLDPDVSNSSVLVDYFDFFKTAFLMMIAFYFGNKSLETLGYKSQKSLKGGGEEEPQVLTKEPQESNDIPEQTES